MREGRVEHGRAEDGAAAGGSGAEEGRADHGRAEDGGAAGGGAGKDRVGHGRAAGISWGKGVRVTVARRKDALGTAARGAV